jgi:hypothetical protein
MVSRVSTLVLLSSFAVTCMLMGSLKLFSERNGLRDVPDQEAQLLVGGCYEEDSSDTSPCGDERGGIACPSLPVSVESDGVFARQLTDHNCGGCNNSDPWPHGEICAYST